MRNNKKAGRIVPDIPESKLPDFHTLGRWCQERRGQVMVCESQGASWLPFEPITTVVGSTHRKTVEMLWQNHATTVKEPSETFAEKKARVQSEITRTHESMTPKKPKP